MSVPQPLNSILEKDSDEHQNDPKWKLFGYGTGSWHTHDTARFPRCRHTEQQQEQPEGQAARSRPARTAQAPLRFRRQKQSSPVRGLKGEDTPDGIKALQVNVRAHPVLIQTLSRCHVLRALKVLTPKGDSHRHRAKRSQVAFRKHAFGWGKNT